MTTLKIKREGDYERLPLTEEQALGFVRECLETTYLNDVCHKYGLPVPYPVVQQVIDTELNNVLHSEVEPSGSHRSIAIERCVRLYIPNYALSAVIERVRRNTPQHQPPSPMYHLARALLQYKPGRKIVGKLTSYDVFAQVINPFGKDALTHAQFLRLTKRRIDENQRGKLLLFNLSKTGLRIVIRGDYEQHKPWIARFGKEHEMEVSLHYAWVQNEDLLVLYDEFGEINKKHGSAPSSMARAQAERMSANIANHYRAEKLHLLVRLANEE